MRFAHNPATTSAPATIRQVIMMECAGVSPYARVETSAPAPQREGRTRPSRSLHRDAVADGQMNSNTLECCAERLVQVRQIQKRLPRRTPKANTAPNICASVADPARKDKSASTSMETNTTTLQCVPAIGIR